MAIDIRETPVKRAIGEILRDLGSHTSSEQMLSTGEVLAGKL
ncbi:MAG: hypothetical protein AAF830_04950 [Pseudomonadota bacterium]